VFGKRVSSYSINTPLTTIFSADIGNSSVLYRQKCSLWTLTALFTIECQLPKLDVAGSIPVSRSNVFNKLRSIGLFFCSISVPLSLQVFT